MIDIALCLDKNMIPGLHVTLFTALTHLSSAEGLRVHLFYEGLDVDELRQIERTLALADKPYELCPYDVDVSRFRHLRALRGNHMTYARLSLADWLDDSVSRVLYLDADLIVCTDLAPLATVDLAGATAGAVDDGGRKRWALDNIIFRTLGIDLDTPYFNPGVLLLDLSAWREQEISREAFRLAEQHHDLLLAHDQTVLNLYYQSHPVHWLPSQYNRQVYPSDEVVPDAPPAIYHLLGVPKPWDLFGERIHTYGSMFTSWLDQTALKGWRSYTNVSVGQLQRTLRYSRSYYLTLRSRAASRKRRR